QASESEQRRRFPNQFSLVVKFHGQLLSVAFFSFCFSFCFRFLLFFSPILLAVFFLLFFFFLPLPQRVRVLPKSEVFSVSRQSNVARHKLLLSSSQSLDHRLQLHIPGASGRSGPKHTGADLLEQLHPRKQLGRKDSVTAQPPVGLVLVPVVFEFGIFALWQTG